MLATDPACQQKLVDSVLKTHSVSSAFESIEQSFPKNPEFAVNCHALAHSLGTTTYKLFYDHLDFTLSPKASDCNWGFYHGFMDSFVQSHGSPDQARKFCDYVDNQLKQHSSGAVFACYHGIGHGSSNNHDPKYWGDALAMANSALKVCAAAAGSALNLTMCASGVFMGLNEFANSNLYQLAINKSDPLFLCREVGSTYQLPCYSQSYVVLDKLTNRNLVEATKFISDIKDDANAAESMRSMASALLQIGDSAVTTIHTCQIIETRLRQPCLDGLVLGIIEKAPPDQAADLALSFCQSSELNYSEAEGCYRQVIIQIKARFDNQVYGLTCQRVVLKFRNLCQN